MAIRKPPQSREPFQTGTLVNGPRNLLNIDNIQEVLEWAEAGLLAFIRITTSLKVYGTMVGK